ncbi:MAG: large-conductance mechanosensitive channel protein MscL [Eubacteriales bacterium]|nr:large-conductance mechanosensitive channel protein MscL [Eubacteriales bacterium]
MWKDFKEFLAQGNVMDLAVAVVIGGAFGKIVTSLVEDLLMPIIALLTSGINFTQMVYFNGYVTIAYGHFIQSIVDFIIIAFFVFLAVRLIKNMRNKQESEPAAPPAPTEAELLTEIRDLLKSK